MNCWDLRLGRQPVGLWFAENQKEGVNAAHGCFLRIVELCVAVAVLLKLVHSFFSTRAEIIQSTKDDRFGWTHFCAGWDESALLSIVTKCTLERAACIGKWLGAAVDHAEWTRNDAVAAAVADIVLHKHGTDLGAHDRAGRAGFEATGFFAMFANVGEKNPAEWIFSVGIT